MLRRKLIRMALLAAMGIAAFSANALAGGLNDLGKRLDPTNKDSVLRQAGRDIDKSIPRFPARRESTSGWSDGWESRTEIDQHGNVTEVIYWDHKNPSRTSRGRVATLKHTSAGRAYWEYGGVRTWAAPQYDLKTSYRTTIDPNTGAVYREGYVGSQKVSNQQIGWAQLVYASNGRPYYQYGSTSVPANKPWKPVYNNSFHQPQQNSYQGQQYPQQGHQNSYQHQNNQDPGAAIAAGILQIIAGALDQ